MLHRTEMSDRGESIPSERHLARPGNDTVRTYLIPMIREERYMSA